MNIIKSLTNYLNHFKPVSVEQDAVDTAKAAQLEIAHCNETIKRAAYIRYMAQCRITAIDNWLNATVFYEVPAPVQKQSEENNDGKQ